MSVAFSQGPVHVARCRETCTAQCQAASFLLFRPHKGIDLNIRKLVVTIFRLATLRRAVGVLVSR